MKPVSSIQNLGPRSEEEFERAGIHSAEEVHTLGADAAYARLLRGGTRAHFIGYYSLVMGLQGRPWNDAGRDEKAELRQRFDALLAEARQTPMGLERDLDAIGLPKRR